MYSCPRCYSLFYIGLIRTILCLGFRIRTRLCLGFCPQLAQFFCSLYHSLLKLLPILTSRVFFKLISFWKNLQSLQAGKNRFHSSNWIADELAPTDTHKTPAQ